MNLVNKKNIGLVILETKKKNCTESTYFNWINKNIKLKYNLISVCIGNNPNENDLWKLRFLSNIKKIILVKDNDVNDINKEKILKIKNGIKNIFNLTKFEYIVCFGIPENKYSFDHFLLMHFDSKTFDKEKRNPQKFFKKQYGEKYKTSEKLIEKILKDNKYKENLFTNSKIDKNYFELVKIIFEK